ncbi:hypothetical protein [Spirosoma jeollabukense]
MKKPIEKLPIDELFARKLGNMSLPPKADGFERLQARMGQGKPEAKIVFWQNPSVQRYMATAACLILVCLFGWLYWPAGEETVSDDAQMAVNKSVVPKQVPIQNQKEKVQLIESEGPGVKAPDLLEQKAKVEQVAKADKPSVNKSDTDRPIKQSQKAAKSNLRNVAPVANEPVLAQIKSVEKKPEPTTSPSVNPTTVTVATSEQLAENKTVPKPAPAAERVLVVTIAEPEALVAARQAVVASIEEKSTVAVADKPAKEAKGNSLWQQVKRIKQGEVLARGDNNDNESSLLGRAYSGLKHSLEKDKSAKQ